MPKMKPATVFRALPLLGALLLGGRAYAEPGTWMTDLGVGANEVSFELNISCPGVGFACSLIDGYSDTQVSQLSGGAGLDVDQDADTIQLETDSTQDLGGGPQPAYLTLDGTDLTFALIPLAGVPEVTDVVVFSVTSPPIAVPGLALLVPGDYPFSTTLEFASVGDVVGDLELILPDIVVPANPAVVNGTLRVLGDIDDDDMTEYELLDLSGQLQVQVPGNLAGEPVTIDVVATLTANLSGEVAEPEPLLVPATGPAGAGLLMLALGLLGAAKARRA